VWVKPMYPDGVDVGSATRVEIRPLGGLDVDALKHAVKAALPISTSHVDASALRVFLPGQGPGTDAPSLRASQTLTELSPAGTTEEQAFVVVVPPVREGMG
jgi:hypothetical protein